MTDTTQITGLAGWAVGLMETLGGPGIALAIFLDVVFPPIPSEVVLPLAGFTARLGDLTLVEVIAWSTLGSIVGAWVFYGLGAALGLDRTRRLVARIPLVDAADFDRTSAWFERHGPKAIFFGRMVPVFRSLISLPAGVQRMHPLLFTGLTLAGSLIWNAIFILAGYALGASWHAIEPYSSVLQYVVVAAILVAIAVFVVRRLRRRAAGATPDGR